VAIRLRAVRARRKLARMLRAGRMETRRGRVPRGQEIG
jgi:hypothetical protein